MSASPKHPANSQFTISFKPSQDARGAFFWWSSITLLLGSLLLVAQFPRFVEATASLWGNQFMFWACIVIFGAFVMCVIGVVALFKWGEIEFGSGMLMFLSWFASLALFAFSYNAFAFSEKSWIGMFQYGRINEVSKITAAVKKDSASQSLPQVLIAANGKMEGVYIQKAYAFSDDVWWGDEYQRAILSARLLGFDQTPEFQQAVKQGWLSKSQGVAWGKQLRNSPPGVLKASPLHQAAYLRMIEEVPMSRSFNIEGKEG